MEKRRARATGGRQGLPVLRHALRRTPVRALLVALVALLAYAITGLAVTAPDASVANGRNQSFLDAESAVVLLAILFAAVAALVMLVTFARTQEFAKPPKRGWHDILAGIALFLACLLVAHQIGVHNRSAPLTRTPSGAPPRDRPSTVTPSRGVNGHLDVIAVLLLALIVALLVTTALRSRRRTRVTAVPQSPADRAADLIDAVLLDLANEPDARRAVIAAYARMERLMRQAGHPRAAHETPMEYLARVLVEVGARAGSVDRLTMLYERAQYSDHAVGPAMKAAALEALETLREELRGTATTSEVVPW